MSNPCAGREEPANQGVRMSAVKKILVPLDFSQDTRRVADYAKMLASHLQAKILVLYVIPSFNQYALYMHAADIDGFAGKIAAGARESMDECLKIFAGQEANGRIAEGYPPDVILQVAEEEQADLIVIGCHGRTTIEHLLLGSVADRVVKHANRPVVTVPPHP